MIKNIICDLDQTLISSGIHYIKAQENLGKYIEEETGIPSSITIELSKNIDLHAVHIDGNFKKERFPLSFSITSKIIDMILGHSINEARANTCYHIANDVYNAKCELMPGVTEFLEYAKLHDWQLFLWTKGDNNIQVKKVNDSGLSIYFKQENIQVVQKKDSASLNNLVNIHSLNKDECIVIGDSRKDDINSAHHAGIKSCWLEGDGEKNSGWAYDYSGAMLYDWKIKTLEELILIIEAYNK